ncbi:MAG: PKD domain-containing protein [Acidobacteriales bacterium]|nr:PKD domain-containing protein [Terriglobales bacterium]
MGPKVSLETRADVRDSAVEEQTLRKLTVIFVLTTLCLPAFAALQISPTTTLTAETANNTSAADGFATQTNGNVGATNVSKLPIRELLYPGANTRIYAHFMPWFGPTNHMAVGYESSDPAQVKRQVKDMISRGINGAIVDWYGPLNTHHDTTTLNLMREAELHAGFEFAIVEDVGAIKYASDPQQKLIDDLNYVNTTYAPSPAYMRRGGRPVIFFFGIETLATLINWDSVRASVLGNPLFIFRNSGGFTKPQTNGGFAWLQTQTALTGGYMSLEYLSNFYSTALRFPALETFGSGFKGFDDSLSAWGKNRKILQYCGQTWLASMAEAGEYYSSSNQLENLQLVTWNDYEEGTEIETGVDNCLSITAGVQGSALNWSITGSESTIDHYSVFISLDGENLMRLAEVGPGNFSLNLGSFSLGPATYQLFVKAVGKPSIVNRMSAAATYTVPNKPPVARLAITPNLGNTPVTVTASTAGSSDVDGSIAATAIDFGDGTVTAVPAGGSASHQYTAAGSYTVSARVTDNLGAWTTATGTVTAITRAVAISKPLNNSTVNSPVQILATANTAHPLYAVQIYVDGVKLYEQSSGNLDTSLNLAPGPRTITVKAWDKAGSFMSSVRVMVNQPPLARLAVSPATGVSPAKITASTAGSSDADGSITSTLINFGDGTSATVASGGSTSHVYPSAGTYTVTSTVTDNNGAKASASATVKVLAPYVTISAPVNGATPVSPVRVIATGFSGNPVTMMKIYVDGIAVYSVNAAKVDRYLNMARGTRRVTAQAWDSKGTIFKSTVYVTVR